MTPEFIRQRLADNITFLMKEQKRKVGDVENAVGISTGYLSKMLKKDTEAAPSTDIIWKLAKVLGVSTDLLIEGDFSKATDNLRYLSNFLKKLTARTDSNELEWERIPVRDIDLALMGRGRELPIIEEDVQDTGERILQPAFYYDHQVSNDRCGKRKIHSHGVEVAPTWVTDSSFRTELSENKFIYIFPMCCQIRISEDGDTEDIDYYDIYLEQLEMNDKYLGRDRVSLDANDVVVSIFEPILNTFNVAQELSSDARALYQSIARHEYDLKIKPAVKDAIAEFMSDGKAPWEE